MKPSLLIFPLFMLLATCSLAQHVLRLEARPLDRIPETEGSVWNLSDAAWSETGHADYTVYGDTLFSETIDGVRRWYLMRADSVGFIREESMRHSFEPYGSVPTAATGMAGMESCIDTVRGEGFSYNTMRLLREGSYSSRGPVAGRLGTGARRTIGYDVHGWVRATGTSTRSGELYEYIRYADDAAKPRYNGFISRRQWGKLNGFSHTYDYTYDGNGFLTKASGDGNTHSVSYAYDSRGNMLSMTRRGVTDMLSGGIAAAYGVLDDVAASYSGNRLTGLTVTSGAKTFSRRTGIGRAGSFTLAYDDAGRLVSDASRGISSIGYDSNGHALSVLYSDGSAHRFNRDGLGNLTGTVYMERCGGTSGAPVVRVAEEREYTSGGHVIVNGRLVMSRFGGGYFDASGKPHYYVTDWQGNNVGVVDRNGLLEQRTDYYPYGEPWIEPEATMSGQGSVVIRPGLSVSAEEGAQDIEATAASSSGSDASVNVFLFGDKERTRTGGLNEYRFPARDYVPGFPRFATIDPMCEVRPHQSPYLYCGGNPVMNTDPTGMFWSDEQEAQRLRDVINNRIKDLKEDIDKNNKKIEENMSKGKEYKKQEESNKEKEAMIGHLEQSVRDIEMLGKDPLHTYSFERVGGEVHRVKQGKRGAVIIQTSGLAYTIHEITHVRQGLDAGGLQFSQYRLLKNPGINDEEWQKASGDNEVEAYKAQFSFDPRSIHGVSNIFNITLEYVGNIKYDDNYGYPWLHDYLYEK